jgi:hypothetical protein
MPKSDQSDQGGRHLPATWNVLYELTKLTVARIAKLPELLTRPEC